MALDSSDNSKMYFSVSSDRLALRGHKSVRNKDVVVAPAAHFKDPHTRISGAYMTTYHLAGQKWEL